MNYKNITLNYTQEQKQAVMDLFPKIVSVNPEFVTSIYNCGPQYKYEVGDILNLPEVDGILFFKMHAQFKSRIHIDMNLSTNEKRTCALNIPLTSCEHVIMKWFDKIEGSSHREIIGSSLTYAPVLSEEDVILTETGKLNRPILAQIHSWHSVENNTTNVFDEHFVSVRFRRDLKEDEILKMLNQ